MMPPQALPSLVPQTPAEKPWDEPFAILSDAPAEAILLHWLLYRCRLYNAALEHRIGAWKKARFSVGYNAQTGELTELRRSDPEAAAIPVIVLRSALRRLAQAYEAFYRRCSTGGKPGFPRFRARQRYNSFAIGRPRVEANRVYVPKIGPIRFHLYRPLRGSIREVTVRRHCGRWFVCFSCDLGDAPPKVQVHRATGIDLGLNSFAVLSDGSAIANPRFFRRAERKLARRQRPLARKRPGSRSRERAKLLVAKAHQHIQQQRLDHGRKLACSLYERYDLVAFEDLRIAQMVRGTLAKSISDAAWGTLLDCLTRKAESAGRHAVAVDPRGTSQSCSACGRTVKKELSERHHDCLCGLSIGRDHNAARNILALPPGGGAVDVGRSSM
jgi:putative transposase